MTSSAAAVTPATVSQITSAAVAAVRHSRSLPQSADDSNYYRSIPTINQHYQQLTQTLNKTIQSIQQLIHPAAASHQHAANSLTKSALAALHGNATPSHLPAASATSTDVHSSIRRSIDTLLENVDLQLDRYKRGDTASTQANATAVDSHATPTPTSLPPHNTYLPWLPVITEKPHAVAPLIDYSQLRSDVASEMSNCLQHSVSELPPTLQQHLQKLQLYDSHHYATNAAFPSAHILSSHLRTRAKPSHAHHTLPPPSPNKQSTPLSTLQLLHPYYHEISELQYKQAMVSAVDAQSFSVIDVDACQWIDTVDALQTLITAISTEPAIAIDLEHHDYHSYHGFTCLIQLSTRTADYLIDAIALRSSLHMLNTVTANSHIVKVFHGADMDVQWLQRDFGVYVVNLFDTHQASRALNLSSKSLAYLLQHYCSIDTDKKFALSDWRQRPLSKEQLLYAQMDTHYLLYIYDTMKNQLIQQSTTSASPTTPEMLTSDTHRPIPHLLAQTLQQSNAVSLKLFKQADTAQHDAYMRNVLTRLAAKSSLNQQLNAHQLAVLQALYLLRDSVARYHDKSVIYTCANLALYNLASKLPNNTKLIHNILSNHPTMRQYSQTIEEIIKECADLQPVKVKLIVEPVDVLPVTAASTATAPTSSATVSISAASLPSALPQEAAPRSSVAPNAGAPTESQTFTSFRTFRSVTQQQQSQPSVTATAPDASSPTPTTRPQHMPHQQLAASKLHQPTTPNTHQNSKVARGINLRLQGSDAAYNALNLVAPNHADATKQLLRASKSTPAGSSKAATGKHSKADTSIEDVLPLPLRDVRSDNSKKRAEPSYNPIESVQDVSGVHTTNKQVDTEPRDSTGVPLAQQRTARPKAKKPRKATPQVQSEDVQPYDYDTVSDDVTAESKLPTPNAAKPFTPYTDMELEQKYKQVKNKSRSKLKGGAFTGKAR